MFSKIIADEQKKRDEALEQISQEMQGLARVFPFNAVTEAVQNSPWQTCAISLGAGLAASSLIPAKTKTVAAPAQPQRVVIDLRNVGASAETPPPPKHSYMDIVTQALAIIGALRQQSAPAQPVESESHSTNGAVL